MELQAYLAGLPEGKREALLGRETVDPLHAAFAKKRVVHAGLLGAPVAPGEQQRAWQAAMAREADASRQHAIYLHIPFCRTKCLYCNFFQNATCQQAEDDYVDDLLRELRQGAETKQLQTARIDSVFFGGGTPTSLSPRNAERLLRAVREEFHLADDCEVTMEGRIHDLVPEKIETWLRGGVNRISLGVQSFDTELRRRVGRLDAREEVLRRLAALRAYDVTIIVDLIYGLPGQTEALWRRDLTTLLAAGVDGMDLYQLNIFPGGDLDRALRSGRVPPCADVGGQADLYLAARDFLRARGVERLSLCHWRCSEREQSRYNTMVKAGAVVYPFGCGAGGNCEGLSFMQQRELPAYARQVRAGEKPILMMAHQVERPLQVLADAVVAGLEQGALDFGSLCREEARLGALTPVLSLWQQRGLMREEAGAYRLTAAGEFWYISLTQSLLECLQALWQDGAPDTADDPLADALAEFLPDVDLEARQAAIERIPQAVREMLRHSSREALRTMFSGMPPADLGRMMKQAFS